MLYVGLYIFGRGSHRDSCNLMLGQVLMIFMQGEAVTVGHTDCRHERDTDMPHLHFVHQVAE